MHSLSERYSISWLSRKYKINSDPPAFLHHHSLNTFFKRSIFFYAELNCRIFIKLLSLDFDIISSVDIDTLPACYLASKVKSRKIIFDAHEIFHEVPELKGKRLRRFIWKNLSFLLFNRIKHKYTVNLSLKDRFKKDFNADFEVIRNMPSLQSIDKIPQLANKRLVYLGVINQGRGVELAIKALPKLEGYTLDIIGQGDLYEDMQLLCAKLNLQDRVNFHGYVAPDKIFQLLSQMSIALNVLDPSSDNYKYSLANKFFDYIHAGLPSINMRFIEYENINDSFQLSQLIDNYSVEDLINAIHTISDPYLYNSLQDNCLKARNILNWDKESEKLKEIYS